jgi:hypothetical protein
MQKDVKQKMRLANEKQTECKILKKRNQEKDKIIAQCKSELDEWESLADDGEALVVVSNVCLQSSMEHAGIPECQKEGKYQLSMGYKAY